MLHCYGENSFTFLLFHKLQESGGLVDPLLSNLKQFSDGRKFSDKRTREFNNMQSIQDGEPEVWLFPNFGKRHGFGEPDALVLYGGYTFWFEVETDFNLKNRKSSARAAMNQLFRFHYFNRVLATGLTRRTDVGKNHWALTGPTISNSGKVKEAVLRIARHKVLQEIRSELSEAAQNNRDHYVLLSDSKPQGISEEVHESRVLHTFFNETVQEVDNEMQGWSEEAKLETKPAEPKIENFWYQYYRGDLNQTRLNIENDKVKYKSISSN